jgi:type II secretory pathway pseudopilin PulG
VEIIVVLVLVGVLTAMAGMALVPIAESFVMSRRNLETAQKAQHALSRITRELSVIDTNAFPVIYDSGRSIDLLALQTNGVSQSFTFAWDGTVGSPLLMNGDPLVGNVREFSVANTNRTKAINITLVLEDAPRVRYSTVIYARNL